MYNHYIPQSDGSFRRNSMPESNRRSRPAPPPQHPQTPPEPTVVPEETCPPPEPQTPCEQTAPEPCQCREEKEQRSSPLSFLRSLLPKDIDSTDMIVIALLLLLSGQECEDDLSPLLTIALYFLL